MVDFFSVKETVQIVCPFPVTTCHVQREIRSKTVSIKSKDNNHFSSTLYVLHVLKLGVLWYKGHIFKVTGLLVIKSE